MCLALFAMSFVHFGTGHAGQAWSSELVVHHAGIPLALFVLLQDYRFVLLDAFVRFLANALLAAVLTGLVIEAAFRLVLVERVAPDAAAGSAAADQRLPVPGVLRLAAQPGAGVAHARGIPAGQRRRPGEPREGLPGFLRAKSSIWIGPRRRWRPRVKTKDYAVVEPERRAQPRPSCTLPVPANVLLGVQRRRNGLGRGDRAGAAGPGRSQADPAGPPPGRPALPGRRSGRAGAARRRKSPSAWNRCGGRR